MSTVVATIKDTLLPSDSAKEADVNAPKVSETTPSVADPALVGRTADETVTEHTTVYTSATPDVLESSNHHVMTEAVPITHTPVPDYNETPRAAPAIAGGNLYSILGQAQPVSSTSSAPVSEQVTAPTEVSDAYKSEIPSSDLAWTVRDTDAYTSSQAANETPAATATDAHAAAGTTAAAGAGAAAGTVASSVAASAPAGQGPVEDQFEPTTEQAWSVRGPASNLVSRGPHDHAHVLNTDAAGAAGDAVVPEEDAAEQGQSAVAGATSAPADAKDAATGQVSQAKDAATGQVAQGKDAAKGVAEKPKKLGFVQKVKKALKIGKQYK
ncbi:hypothetical protein MNAN1_003217 [Malassezia nana]|uniref:Uncharacterized protein n=1 Tax=Malassezia nana TaxID=180528 RepID=A0AAF0EP69_9BASI|nr:hypothetical protein MNAN1_003217 [Malassezia nana]